MNTKKYRLPTNIVAVLAFLCALLLPTISLNAAITINSTGDGEWGDGVFNGTFQNGNTIVNIIGSDNVTLSTGTVSVNQIRVSAGTSPNAILNVGGGDTEAKISILNTGTTSDIGRSANTKGTLNILTNGTFDASVLAATKGLFVGYSYNSVGTINVLGGTLLANYLTLGHSGANSGGGQTGDVGGSGTLNIESGTVTITNSLVLGNNTTTGTAVSSGNLNISGGSLSVTAATGTIVIGNGSSGTSNVTVSGGSVTSASSIYVGNSSQGQLDVKTGGTVTQSGGVSYVGATATGDGVFNVDGGTVSLRTITIGDAGKGVFNLNTGSVTVGSSVDTNVGNADGGDGTLKVAGGIFSMTNASANLIVGNQTGSTGNLELSAGTMDIAGRVIIGDNGKGTAIVTGGNLIIKAGTGGSLIVGNGAGTGSLQMTNGNVVLTSSAGDFYLGYSNNATLRNSANGTATLTDSKLSVGRSAYIGSYGNAILSMNNSTMSVVSTFVIGNGGGTARASLLNGSKVTAASMTLGGYGTHNGYSTLTLDSTSSIIITGDLLLRKAHTDVGGANKITFVAGADNSFAGITTGSLSINQGGTPTSSIIPQIFVDLTAFTTSLAGDYDFDLITTNSTSLTLADFETDVIGAGPNVADWDFFLKEKSGDWVLGLTVSVIPEPSTYAIVLALLAVLAVRMKRRG